MYIIINRLGGKLMEYLDLYDENKRLTGEKIIRKKENQQFPKIIILILS